MFGVGIRVQQADRDGLRAGGVDFFQQCRDLYRVQCNQYVACRRHPLMDGQGPVPRHQPISLFEIDIILAIAPLIRDLKNIAEPFGGDGRKVIPPFLMGCVCRTYAAIFSFCAGVMLPMPMFGRSLL
jgi:hypothetical protein